MKIGVAATILLVAGAAQAASVPIDGPKNEVAQIYASFVGAWNGKNQKPLNVSKSAELPTRQETEGYNACLAGQGSKEVVLEAADPIADLGQAIGHLSFVHLVESAEWQAADPGDLISRGKPVKAAVDTGVSAGLLTLSAISFDKEHNVAAFTYSFTCGRLCGTGGSVIFRKSGSNWVQSKRRCGSWMS